MADFLYIQVPSLFYRQASRTGPPLCSWALLVRLLSQGIMGESAATSLAVLHLLLNPLQHLLHPSQLQRGINEGALIIPP